MMSTRTMRMTGAMVALLLVLAGAIAGRGAAQVATPLTEQPVTIAGSEITWSGDWTYTVEASTSIPEQVTFSQVDIQTQILKVLSYGLLPAEAGADATTAIDGFSESFLEDGGATDVNEVVAGQLEDGTVWKLYTMNASESAGVSSFGEGALAALITASPAAAGGYAVTSLTTNGPLIQESIVQVQGEFVLDGTGQFFMGIDAAAVTADLPTENLLVTGANPGATPEATPLASPEITVVDSSAATPPGSPAAAQGDGPDATPLTGAEGALATVQSGATTPEPTVTP